MLKVGQLEEHLAKRQENSIAATMGQYKISDDAAELTIVNGVQSSAILPMDEVATKALTKYLHVPYSYYNNLDPDFKATVLRYEIERNSEVKTVAETLNGDLVAVHQPEQLMLPQRGVAKVIEKVFSTDDTVQRFIADSSRLHVDVTTNQHTYEFPTTGADGLQVGDITEAGVRFLAHPYKSVAPSTSLYAHRLACMNGQVTPERLGRIEIKGRTIDEVFIEMEEAANEILGQLDGYLEKLAATRSMEVPGSPQAFAAQLAREQNLSRAVLDAVLDIVNQLPTPVTVWDINQAFTNVATHHESYAVQMRLQGIGGALGFDAEAQVQRCTSCERRL